MSESSSLPQPGFAGIRNDNILSIAQISVIVTRRLKTPVWFMLQIPSQLPFYTSIQTQKHFKSTVGFEPREFEIEKFICILLSQSWGHAYGEMKFTCHQNRPAPTTCSCSYPEIIILIHYPYCQVLEIFHSTRIST